MKLFLGYLILSFIGGAIFVNIKPAQRLRYLIVLAALLVFMYYFMHKL